MTVPLPELDAIDCDLVAIVAEGLPLVRRPYAAVGAMVGLAEQEVIRRLERLISSGVIKRLGVVVRHHELGFKANAMAVWDVPDDVVSDIGRRAAALPFVTLCYRRPRRLPDWPYNLFCMVHGRDRFTVRGQIDQLARDAGLDKYASAILFSNRRFKQRGARYPRSLPERGAA